MDKKQIVNLIKEIIPIIKDQISLDYLVLFGSHAKGTFSETSDIDIAIISKDIPKEIINEKTLKVFSKIRDVNLDIEPHFVRMDRWNNANEGSFIDTIKKTGNIIYSGD